jgi:hypothetical protein
MRWPALRADFRDRVRGVCADRARYSDDSYPRIWLEVGVRPLRTFDLNHPEFSRMSLPPQPGPGQSPMSEWANQTPATPVQVRRLENLRVHESWQ